MAFQSRVRPTLLRKGTYGTILLGWWYPPVALSLHLESAGHGHKQLMMSTMGIGRVRLAPDTPYGCLGAPPGFPWGLEAIDEITPQKLFIPSWVDLNLDLSISTAPT